MAPNKAPSRGASASSQVLIIALTCFCCPGLFNALSSVASGIADPSIAYNGTSILYGFFAVFGLVAGGLVNLSYGIPLSEHHKFDFKQGGYWIPFVLYGYYGFCDAICQVWSYWLMGQMSDDISVLGRYSGYYKAVQSAMAAVSWKIGAVNVNPLLINWVLSVVGMVGAYISIRVYVSEYSGATGNEYEYDLALSPGGSLALSPGGSVA
ncbi:TPA: LOW QUALITY PROTEIN: hypothetical protein N0F65_006727 [Lagenidium giganteum]|uniref:Uncharacterized protein n=1 Tax=Lagenidium giganteum TaxID=4803 RepID=A0AAV2Z9D7_9STRA|nr:TPA: LOW QUALITY PROTEIN: hypothetical protein N0F65_006727 [Lagenidium giganteum]